MSGDVSVWLSSVQGLVNSCFLLNFTSVNHPEPWTCIIIVKSHIELAYSLQIEFCKNYQEALKPTVKHATHSEKDSPY